jgi:hypothetical protein
MCNFRLKCVNGLPLRKVYEAFEIEAVKFAVDNNYTADAYYQFGKSGENFRVTENSDTYVKVLRVKTNKYIEFYKVVKVEDCTKVVHNDVKPAPVVPAAAPVAPVSDGNNNDVTAKIMAALTPAIAAAVGAAIPAPATPVVDVDAVNAIIDGRLAPFAGDILSMKDEIKNMCVRHDISINNAPSVHIDGVLHDKFECVLCWCKNRVPVYLFGPAGTGKNVLSEQIATAMGLTFYYCGCLQNKYELEGFVAADGTYQETEFYKAFTEGGVFLFDEIDGTAAEVLIAFNAALANGYYNFPQKGRIKAHKDFIVLAAGNTCGRGGNDAYNGRYQLDASTLDRFAFVSLDYDKKIEMAQANNDADLVNFAHDLRDAIKKQNLTYTVSPRALHRVVVAIACGCSISDALKMSVCGGWSADDIKLLAVNLCGGDKYTFEFQQIANNL